MESAQYVLTERFSDIILICQKITSIYLGIFLFTFVLSTVFFFCPLSFKKKQVNKKEILLEKQINIRTN